MFNLTAVELLMGIATAMLTLLSSVWYTAVSVNNRNRDILFMKEGISSINESLHAIDATLVDRDERLELVERNLEEALQEMVSVIYINSDHILLETYEGRVVKVPMVVQ